MSADAVVYEVNLEIAPDIVSEFDPWLNEHVTEMLTLPGFEGARVLVPEHPTETADAAGWQNRQVEYRVRNRAMLESYFKHDAPRMRRQGAERFGDSMRSSRRVYLASDEYQPGVAPAPLPQCLNCGARLPGQFCYECGQRAKSRVISVWSLFRDLIGDVFELDSRLWRSLAPLMFRPGHLTREFLGGRRVYYTPPLRMYLVLSLAFFFVLFFGAKDNLNVNLGDDGTTSDDTVQTESTESDAGGVSDDAAVDADPAEVEPVPPAETSEQDRCEDIDIESDEEWVIALKPQIKQVCERLTSEGGAEIFVRGLIDNAPLMMFVFLPIMALIMKLLYPFARRFYVEHLLFLVHYHSFFFLALTATILAARAPSLLPGQGLIVGVLIAVVSIYTPIYLYRAMRVVYGQIAVFTLMKYLLLVLAYLIALIITFLVAALYAALTV